MRDETTEQDLLIPGERSEHYQGKPTIVVKIEQNREKDCKRDSKEDIPDADIPEMDQPRPIHRGKESRAGGQCGHLDIFHMPHVHKASEEDNRQRRTVVFKKFSNHTEKEAAFTELATYPCRHQHEKRNHDAQIGRGFSRGGPLSRQDLDALLEVDERNVETENVA